MPPLEARRWTSDELEADRQRALTNFVASWGQYGTQLYRDTVDEVSRLIRELFLSTDDLKGLSGETFTSHPQLVAAARFLTAPPVSADDLKTLIGGTVGVKKPNPDRASRAAEIVRSAWDPLRFPWLAADRPPSDSERETAIAWTASIWAIEALRTLKRNTSAKEQEGDVAQALERAGLQQASRRPILTLDDLERGTFTRECRIGGHKCDVPVRLIDGRLLAIECKVSNSAVNSKKRLNNDVGAKAADWNRAYGTQIVTAAVLTGVFALVNLVTAQDNQRIAIYWAHNLDELIEFARSAK
jgi:hypothetical protein